MEAAASTAILTAGVLVALQIGFMALHQAKTAREAALVQEVIDNELAWLRCLPPAALNEGRHGLHDDRAMLDALHLAEGEVSMQPWDGAPSLWEVEVTVRWVARPGHVARRSVTTLLPGRVP